MSKRKIAFLLLATLAIVAFSRLGVFNKISGLDVAAFTAVPRINLDDLTPLTDVTGIDPTDLVAFPAAAEGIAVFQERIRRNPQDAISLTLLGQLYLRQARQTGDVSGYQRAETALNQALELFPGYPAAQASLASVQYAQHNFLDALALAEPLYQEDPRRTDALVIIGDASLALGRYPQAAEAYRELVSRGATPPLLARLAHQAELAGDPEYALQLMQHAAGETLAAGLSREDMAWYLIHLGDLQFKTGQIEEAGTHYEAALRVYEDYYIALAGLGKARASQGRYDEAIALYEQAVAVIPQPDFLAALGGVYALVGNAEAAQRQYDTVEFIGKLAAINRQVYNRQLANFYADHDLRLDESLKLAQAEFRRDIYGYDTAAWAYYKNEVRPQKQDVCFLRRWRLTPISTCCRRVSPRRRLSNWKQGNGE